MPQNLTPLFQPRAIAVVGASAAPEKAGYAMMQSLAGFPGPVYPVNPKAAAAGESILGTPAIAAPADAAEQVDLAVLVVPPQAVPAALADCGAAGVRAAVVCAGGFAESGEAGERLQEETAAVARAHGIRLLGPNTSGFINPADAVCASFLPAVRTLQPGSVAVLAQSGGVNLALSFMLQQAGVGLRLGVGLGNAVDVGFADILDHLADDEQTTAVALHVEGVTDGAALMAAVRRVAERKPVVALKVGRSDVGDFARSHTGALTGSYELTRAALAQSGAVLVESPAELVDALSVLGRTRLPAAEDPGVGIITGQAGPGLIIADALASAGVRMPDLTEASTARLGELLPPLTYQRNPVDTGRPGATFPDVVATVAADPAIDVLGVYALDEPGALDPSTALDGVAGRVVFASGGPAEDLAVRAAALAERGIAMVDTPDRLARGLIALVGDARARHALEHETAAPAPGEPRTLGATLDEDAGKSVLESLGVPAGARRVATTHDEAHRALAELGAPVVVKILDAEVLHKSDVGGVHVNVRSAEDLDAALRAIDAVPAGTGSTDTGSAGSRRYLLEEQAADGVELLVGGLRDEAFGPVVVLGLGGVDVELAGAVAHRVAPITPAAARAMVRALPPSLLAGHRGKPAVDVDALAAVITAVGEVLTTYGDATEIDLNPVRMTAAGPVLLDALVVTAQHTKVGTPVAHS